MIISSENTVPGSDIPDIKQKFSNLLFRVWPFWPIVLIALLIAFGGSYLYLKKEPKIYEVRAQIVVNDVSQNKNNNLLNKENSPVDQFNQLSLVEKQIEVLKSNGLLEGVVKEKNLNIHWSNNKLNGNYQLFQGLPVSLQLLDSVQLSKEIIEGPVHFFKNKNQVEFKGTVYSFDSTVVSPLGKCRWSLNRALTESDSGFYLKIIPIENYADLLKSRFEAVELAKQSPIVNLSLNDEVPENGEFILNSIINYYGELSLEKKKKILEKTLDFIDERLGLVSQNLKLVESTLQNYKSRQGITDLASEGQIYLDQAKDNYIQISDIDIQISIINEIQQYLASESQSTSSFPATLGLTDQMLLSFLNELYKDISEKESLLRLSGEKNPKIKVLEDRIAQRKISVLQSVSNLRKSLQTNRQSLIQNGNRFNQTLRSIPQKERGLIDLSRDQSVKNELYTFLLQKREEAAIAAASIEPEYTVIEKPVLFGLVKPKPILIYGYGLLIAFAFSGIWIYKKEFANSTILYRSEIESRTNIPIIGELINDRTVITDAIVVESQSRTLIAEQFRDLRININYLLHTMKESKIILVTSSVPSEGKSFVSLNLAASFALAGKKTVLLEFDLYKPKISERLGIENNKGISDFLMNKATASEICIPYEKKENLWLVPSGSEVENPAELILNERLPLLIEYLKSEFEYLIIDTPCVGMVSDTKILANYSCLSLYVIRQHVTNHGFMKFINQLKESGTIPKLQIIFNGVIIKKTRGLNYWESYGVNGYRSNNKNPYSYFSKEKKTEKQ